MKKHVYIALGVALIGILFYYIGYVKYRMELDRMRPENFGSLSISDVQLIKTLSRYYPFVDTRNVEIEAECYLVSNTKDNIDQIVELFDGVNRKLKYFSACQYRDIIKKVYSVDWKRRLPLIVKSVTVFAENFDGSHLNKEDTAAVKEIFVLATINVFPLRPNSLVLEGEVASLLLACKHFSVEYLPEVATKYVWMYANMISNHGKNYSEIADRELVNGGKYLGVSSDGDFNLLTLHGLLLLKEGVKKGDIGKIDLSIGKYQQAYSAQTMVGNQLYATANLLRAKVEKGIVQNDQDVVSRLLPEINNLVTEYKKNEKTIGPMFSLIYEVYVLQAETLMFVGERRSAIISYNNAIGEVAKTMGIGCPLIIEYKKMIDLITKELEADEVDPKIM